MNCEHCEPMRARLRELTEKHGEMAYRDSGAELTRDLQQFQAPPVTESMMSCRCACHDIARIAGKLPKLAAAS